MTDFGEALSEIAGDLTTRERERIITGTKRLVIPMVIGGDKPAVFTIRLDGSDGVVTHFGGVIGSEGEPLNRLLMAPIARKLAILSYNFIKRVRSDKSKQPDLLDKTISSILEK